MSGSVWKRAFLFLFLACLGASLTYTLFPSRSAPPYPVPRPVYWFWPPEILEKETYLDHARDLVRRGPFDLVFATPRYPQTGVDFLDVKRFAPLFKQVVAVLEEGGIGLGLDLRFYLGVGRDIPRNEQQGLVERLDVVLDEKGKGKRGLSINPVMFPGVARETGVQLLRVYDAGPSLSSVKVIRAVVDGKTLSLDCGKAHGGKTVSALVHRTFNHPDMFSAAYPRAFTEILKGYQSVGLRGAALDEFAYLPVKINLWKKRLYYSDAAAAAFKDRYSTDFVDTIARILLDLPERAARIRAVNRYNEHHRDAIAAVERRFYQAVKTVLGKDTFVGIHPTNQTRENYCDLEISLTEVDWWSVPRDFAQTDEQTPMAIRMGMALKAGGPVWYNMYYDKKPGNILDEVVRCARFGGRVHYHAYFDSFHGYPLEKGTLLETISHVENRLGVLDRHIRTMPELDTLVILGWPWMTNWLEAREETSPYTRTMVFLNKLWDRGYRAAAVPTYEIGTGHLNIVDGKPTYGGRTFEKVILYHPEYADTATVRFLESLTRTAESRNTMQVVGELTTRFDGKDEPFGKSLARLRISEEKLLENPGPALHEKGVRYPGRLRVLVDRASLVNGDAVEQTVEAGGKRHSFRFTGVAVLEEGPDGIQKVSDSRGPGARFR